jgi:hypothetical protein
LTSFSFAGPSLYSSRLTLRSSRSDLLRDRVLILLGGGVGVQLRRLGDLPLDLERDLLRLVRERLRSDGKRDRDCLPLDLDVRDILNT